MRAMQHLGPTMVGLKNEISITIFFLQFNLDILSFTEREAQTHAKNDVDVRKYLFFMERSVICFKNFLCSCQLSCNLVRIV